jgi:uncharacterized SAM-binding protein YcdF (DUF218 family)
MSLRSAVLGLGALCGAGWSLTAAVLDLRGGNSPPEEHYDAIVVAGAGVMPGGVPSDALYARTRAATDLYLAGYAPTLALTGGVGDWGPAEAVVAEQLALGWGVPPEAILREERSTSTEENAALLRELLGDRSVLVVTDRYHVWRCERVFRRHFSRADAVGTTSPPYIRARGALREVLAIPWYAVRGRL